MLELAVVNILNISKTKTTRLDGTSRKLAVSLRPGEDDVDPDAHCLGARRHQVDGAIVRFYAECQLRRRTPRAAHVVDEHVFDRLEIYQTTRRFRFRPVAVVAEVASGAVEDEPAALPRSESAAHLGEEAAARRRRDDDVRAGVRVVAGRRHELFQIQVRVADRKVARQRTRLLP